MSLPPLSIPPPEAPQPLPGYGLPGAPVLEWSFVAGQMAAAAAYWIVSAGPDGRPHAVPVWGVWHENRLHFGGRPETRWARNLSANPAVVAHPPDAARVVIIEGRARPLGDDELTEDEWAVLDGAYRDKYQVDGSPYWFVAPERVLAWDGMDLGTMTRWRFDGRPATPR